MKKNNFKSFIIMVLCISFFIMSYSQNVIAQGNTESLNIKMKYVLENTDFNIYKVGYKEGNDFIKTGEFSNYPVDLRGLDNKDIISVAETISSYAKRDKIRPLKTIKSDRNFSLLWKNTEEGLYLINGESKVTGNYIYTPSPVLIYLSSDNNNKEINMELKYEKRKIDNEVEISAFKVWKDGNDSKRPESVEVQLLKNGEVFDSALLNDENNWRISWENLPGDFSYDVLENNVSEGYNVTVYKDSGINRVVNESSEYKTAVPNVPEEKNVVKDYSNIIGKSEHNTSKVENNKISGKIPQTGQFWIPVPVLLIISAYFIYKGFNRDKFTNEK